MNSINNDLGKFFGVAFRAQTYLNALYLLLSFPLGVFYFVFFVTGIALGVPLIIIWIGLLILAAVYAAWYGLIVFERQMAIWMLREEIPPISRESFTGKNLWQTFTTTLANPVTWKGLVYLFAKFPLGILSFSVLVTLVSLSAALVATPFYYQTISPNTHIIWNGAYWNLMGIIDTLPKAILISVIGLFITLVSMHILNGLAWVSGKFARVMLGSFSPSPEVPPASPHSPELPAATA